MQEYQKVTGLEGIANFQVIVTRPEFARLWGLRAVEINKRLLVGQLPPLRQFSPSRYGWYLEEISPYLPPVSG